MNPLRVLAAVAAALLAVHAYAQAPAAAAEKPRVWVLVSAIGSEINVVRQRANVGSNLPNYRRQTVPLPDAGVDTAVLRGLDRAVASEDPDSQRIFMRLNPEEVKGIYAYKRGEVLSQKVIAALEAMPERKDWHRILIVAPRFLNVGREGMGEKLYGIGVYVQPLGRNAGPGLVDGDLESAMDPETVSPAGEKSRSYRFVAPYFYAQLWVIDAKTMKVLETNERYDFQRIYDPMSIAIDVAQQVPVEQLAGIVEKFVERASARALNDQQGEVIIREPRVVDPSIRK